MGIKKVWIIGCMSMISATCVMAQTTKNDYYQPSFTKSYDVEEDDAESLFVDEDDKLNNFQRDAGLTVRDEKQTAQSSKKLERAYNKEAREQKRLNRTEYRKIKENERAYFRKVRVEIKKV